MSLLWGFPSALILSEVEGRGRGRKGLKGSGFFCEGPVKPWRKRDDVGRLNGAATPDTQAGRGLGVTGSIEAGILFFEPLHHRFYESALSVLIKARHAWINNLECHACI